MSSPEPCDCILIADDHAPNLLALEAVLEPLGRRIVKASSGVEALRFLLDHDCSLALLDVAMPGLDGFETAALIRSRERTRHIPIIFISASAKDESQVFQGYAQGAIDYVVKPFDPDVLRAKVTNLLALHRRSEEMRREAVLRRRERDELREKEQEARADAEVQRKRLHTLLMQAPSVVTITKGPDHVFELVNERCQQLLGSRQVLGRPAREALPELSQSAWDSADAVYESGKAFVGTEAAVSLDEQGGGEPERRFFNFVVQPTRDAERGIDGLMLHAFEVTDQVRAREREREAIRLRDEFLSIASHELRTPLTPLRLQLQSTLKCLDNGAAEAADLRPRLELALRQTVRLGTLVSDLLEVSRITSGRLTLQREEMDLAESAREVAERHEPEARNAGTSVSVEAQPIVGRWDRLRIEQVIANLLVNAIKYGGGTPVHLAVVVAVDGAARLTVRDEGIGISTEDQERIFDRFERAVSARSYGGMGLGLYIAQQIVDAHGGRIHVHSARGKGSTFTVDLPVL